MKDISSFLLPYGDISGVLMALWIKATLLCLLGVAIGSEFSAMPAIVRHRIALGTVCCLAVLPLLAVTLGSWELPILPRKTEPGSIESSPIMHMLIWVYVGVAGILLTRLCVDLLRISLLSRRSNHIASANQLLPNIDHPLDNTPVKYSKEIRSPLTWGWLRPQILVPRDASDWEIEELSMVLQHELAHVQRGDWASHLLARCVYALYWPVPGIRLLQRQLSLSAEQACDDRVLATGVSAPQYAAMLLRHAQGNRVPATVSLGHSSELGTRIRNLVAEIVDHSAYATGSAVTFLTCLLLTLPVATAQLSQRPELPVVDWGSGVPADMPEASSYPPHNLHVDPSVLAALESGPVRPLHPPAPEKPPKLNALEKPTVPPPELSAPSQ